MISFEGVRSQVVRQWTVTPSFAGSSPVVRQRRNKRRITVFYKGDLRVVPSKANAVSFFVAKPNAKPNRDFIEDKADCGGRTRDIELGRLAFYH